MKIFIVSIAFCLSATYVLSGCQSGKKIISSPTEHQASLPQQSAPVIVYKTRKDYSKNVPVLLSEDKKQIVAYPAPSDIRKTLERVLPTSLQSGYWLDNRGIGVNVAFLSITYEEYAKLDKAPKLEEMKNMIIDDHPLTEFCTCGTIAEYTDVEQQINLLIAEGKLKEKCKKIKLR